MHQKTSVSKQSKSLKTPWRHILLIHCIFLMIGLLLLFHYVSVYVIFTLHFAKSKLMTGSILVLNVQEKSFISPSRYISHKQPSRGVLRKRCSENKQQIYRRTPMSKCDSNRVALHLFDND